MVAAQTPRDFEVASIKPSAPDPRSSISRSGNNLTVTHYTLPMLITWAYNIRDDRRALLADRFRLPTNTEKRELPFYALVVDKDGTKVYPVNDGQPPGANPFDMTKAAA